MRARSAATVSRAFGLWNKAGGNVIKGLTLRRAREAALYLTPIYVEDNPPVPQQVDPEGWRHDAAFSTMVATHAQVMQGYADAAYQAQELARKEEHRRIAAVENIRNETDQELARVRADERAAADRRVRHAAKESLFAARNRSAAGAGQAGTDPLDLLAELFGRADDRAGELAAALDRSRIAGLACERAYEAVSTGR